MDVFGQWKAPANFKIELFVVRVGEWGGRMLVDCDDPLTVHKVCSTFPAFEFQARPVVAVADACLGANTLDPIRFGYPTAKRRESSHLPTFLWRTPGVC